MMWTRKRQAHDVDPLTISSHGLRRSDPGEEELMSDRAITMLRRFARTALGPT